MKKSAKICEVCVTESNLTQKAQKTRKKTLRKSARSA